MKAAINDRIFNFFNLFSCTFCNDLVIEVCQFVCAFSKALAPVCINSCTVDDAFCCIFIIRFPVNGSTCQSCIRSCFNHRNIVTNTRNTCCLTSCRRTCCICMLADQNTFICDQRFSTFFLKVKTCPAVCVLHFHCSGWTLTSYTKEEGCETADNFCIWISTYITNLSCIFCNLAICDHLIQFHTGYDT